MTSKRDLDFQAAAAGFGIALELGQRNIRPTAFHGIPVSLMNVNILTGRTHQIRVHLASAGIPVLGDATYGGSCPDIPEAPRQMLHAWKLKLPHPLTRKEMEFVAPLPDDFKILLDMF